MKSKDELNQVKAELAALNSKLNELSAEELEEVVGGRGLHTITICDISFCNWDPAGCHLHIGNNKDACYVCRKLL